MSESKAGNRFAYLDNIKWFLTILVVLHHAAIVCGGSGGMYYKLPHIDNALQNASLTYYITVQQSFFMSLFIFISALFTDGSYERKGAAAFLKDKVRRLGYPILLTLFFVGPVVWAIYMGKSPEYGFAHPGEILSAYLDANLASLQNFNINLGVTWFTYTLIVFNVIYVIYRKLNSAPLDTSSQKPFPPHWQIALFIVVMTPFNFAGEKLMHMLGEDFLGFHLLKYFPMYIACFFLGIQAFRSNWLPQINFKVSMPWFVLAVIATILKAHFHWDDEWIRAITVIGFMLFFISVFQQFFTGKNKLSQTMSEASLTVYIFHPVVLVYFSYLMRDNLTDQPVLNWVIIGLATVLMSFVLSIFIRKLPGLRTFL